VARGRTGNRFEHMLSVAIRIIGEEGVHALSHRRLAERAGVPLGSTTYWFESRNEILTQALTRFAAEESATLAERFATLHVSDLTQLIDVIVDHVASQDEEERWRAVAQYAVFEEASRNPALRHALHEWTEQWVKHLAEQLTLAGVDRAESRARVLVPLLDGLLFNQLADPADDFGDQVLRPALHALCDGWTSPRRDR
jgi:TetR/AcrR family transcriptional regulator, regulator of biofilm formation and stress response